VAKAADGNDYSLLNSEGQPWRLDVDVGGEIRVDESSYAKAVIDPRSSDESALMFLNFNLYSGETTLTGAQFLARVVGPEQSVVAMEPVTEGISSEGENFGYQVSWTLGGNQPPGVYRVEFYREADRPRLGAVEPFFVLNVKYDGSSASFLPVRTEFIVIILLGSAFVFATMRKMEITGSSKKK